MKRNTMLACVALLLVVIGGGGLAWAYKTYRAKQREANQEFRFEGTMGEAREGFDIKVFKAGVLSDDTLDKVIEEHKLVAVWGLADAAAAKTRIKEKFLVKLEGSVVKVSYQDKNKDLSQKILQTIVTHYYAKVKGAGRLPVPPATTAPSS